MNARQHVVALAEVNPGAEIYDEVQRRQNEQRVELDPAMNVERSRGRVQLALGSKLKCVRGDGEVILHRDARIVAETDVEAQARNRRHPGRWHEVGIESAQ